jgi:hypothetical protein
MDSDSEAQVRPVHNPSSFSESSAQSESSAAQASAASLSKAERSALINSYVSATEIWYLLKQSDYRQDKEQQKRWLSRLVDIHGRAIESGVPEIELDEAWDKKRWGLEAEFNAIYETHNNWWHRGKEPFWEMILKSHYPGF